MKFYSDTLMSDDFESALNYAQTRHKDALLTVSTVPIRRPRVRSRAWHVDLTDWESNRHRNSGQYGAKTWEHAPPASWDQWGDFMAFLYSIDPAGQFGPYKNREHFEETATPKDGRDHYKIPTDYVIK